MLTGEYLVLNGAETIALATKFGQTMHIESHGEGLLWQANDNEGNLWFQAEWNEQGEVINTTDPEVSERLNDLFAILMSINPEFEPFNGNKITTDLEFPLDWGLGSSSTNDGLLCSWADVDISDKGDLSQISGGGSGYDIVVAIEKSSITFQLEDEGPEWQTISFSFPTPGHWHFIHSNVKQSTAEEIERYNQLEHSEDYNEQIKDINAQILASTSDEEIADLLTQHEDIISQCIGLPPIKSELFSDYPYCVKSLGAWGGDFFLAYTPNSEDVQYFQNKGYNTILSSNDMIKS